MMTLEEMLNDEPTLFGEVKAFTDRGILSKRFGWPPFSVLDSKNGDWQRRKKQWLNLGIKSELGRNAKVINNNEWMGKLRGHQFLPGDGVSVFDPVLCEIVYRWFCPTGGIVVDPFAGGSVRGIVAGCLGLHYFGVDLRQEQVNANTEQFINISTNITPVWLCGDSLDVIETLPNADLIFSCPPYAFLEQYSDNPRDLSNMEWHTFCAAYKRIILRLYKNANDNSFACFVVGNIRDKCGIMRDLVGYTVRAFEECGFSFYNDCVFLNQLGSAAYRAENQFSNSRKLVKVHQNVLCFCKGDPVVASQKLINNERM